MKENNKQQEIDLCPICGRPGILSVLEQTENGGKFNLVWFCDCANDEEKQEIAEIAIKMLGWQNKKSADYRSKR